MRSQQSVYLKGEVVSNHDELMCNFFAQVGRCARQCASVEGPGDAAVCECEPDEHTELAESNNRA